MTVVAVECGFGYIYCCDVNRILTKYLIRFNFFFFFLFYFFFLLVNNILYAGHRRASFEWTANQVSILVGKFAAVPCHSEEQAAILNSIHHTDSILSANSSYNSYFLFFFAFPYLAFYLLSILAFSAHSEVANAAHSIDNG